MINIVCLKWGTKYSTEYVNRLYRMVKKNITVPFSFHCITEQSAGLYPEISVLELKNPELEGWWHKLSLFHSDCYGLKGTVLYLDLDVVITDSLDPVISFSSGSFCTIKSRGKRLNARFNSSVIRFEAGSVPFIWEAFVFNQQWILNNLDGDQDWLGMIVPGATTFPDHLIVSFKKNCMAQGQSWLGIGEKLMKKGLIKPKGESVVPKGAAVVIFHGLPNPEDVAETSYKQWKKSPWIKKCWG
ncbi:hypothetical protein [Thiomicrospira cyclica]|uniref:Glycosyltransferase n=1 Tax=Thiomicrospira cyclica (strain DSM 14477 / JCM 11371 / ALM1) TaxID=717773 RepID=F6DCW9_THICA|nr:hypothetical protein [Thiomicrospira cyclica]AEG31705.1 hypothetical protein Thicy_0938 [Thiomicrospira cyclica ALM1]